MKDRYNRCFERLLGKKIVAIDTSAANCVMIETDEGERMVIDTEPVGHGLVTPIINDINGYDYK